jgi:hypothetical protein
MNGMTWFALIALAFVVFSVYFIFKQLQFVIQAVNLYKTMISRLDNIIELLSVNPALGGVGQAARKQFEPERSDEGSFVTSADHKLTCPFCDQKLNGFGRCTKCGSTIDQAVLDSQGL